MEIESREKFTAQQILLHIKMGSWQMDVQRKMDHEDFMKKEQEFATKIKSFKESLGTKSKK